ncbi:MAG: hypothetical protein CMJ79_14425 [Planctomycetaceae bacterium]|nr:hypothetical protein [Planctomycetaceae bacterium]|tara:strand:+ start:21239 stop:21925 length:687 start_codon:yes stop_codon:yes gene_type:complete
MHLYLIRHGQSENNAKDESLRVQDPGLTALGAQQVAFLGEWFTATPLDVLITSPFRRALLTTVPIYQATGLTPQVRTNLHEIGGCVSGYPEIGYQGEPGMSAEEICEQFPGFQPEHDIDQQGWWKSKPYETTEQQLARVQQVMQQTFEEFGTTDQHVAYVMHADFKQLLLQGFLPELPITSETFGPLRNAGVTILKIEEGRVRLNSYNGIQHLPANLVTPATDSENRV